MHDDLHKWRTFWANQTLPLHRHNNAFFYQLYADELNLLFRRFGYERGNVLESGCGNGALFPYLNIDKQHYTGMDISASLLQQFRSAHPQVNLIEASAENIPNDHFRLIFSNGLGQYLNKTRMRHYIVNASQHLEPQGLLIIGNLLWKSARGRFLAGMYADISNYNITASRRFRAKLVALVQWLKSPADTMGHWVHPEDVLRLVPTSHNTIVGSLFHPYRFSLVIRNPAP